MTQADDGEPICATQARRSRPAFLRALGRDDPPAEVRVDGVLYRREDIFKHDSWAATAVYSAEGSRLAVPKIICKFNRRQSLLGLPAAWIGRRLARREASFLELFRDVPYMPRLLGPVYIDGRIAPNAVARVFISGHPLGKRERTSDEFFAELNAALDAVHASGAAYVDLHKHENVLVGDDGRPYLIDFQVAYRPAEKSLFRFITRRWLTGLQGMDRYCVAKLQRRCRPDLCSLSFVEMQAAAPRWVRMHRLIAQPLRSLRRRLLVLVGVRSDRGRVETERFVEAGLRPTQSKAA